MNWTDSYDLMKSYDMEAVANGSPLICPACHAQNIHLYFHRFEKGDSHGGVWIWCSECHDYTHFRGVIPSWWENPPFIDESQLSSDPEYLSNLEEEIDSWKRQRLSAH